jgi:hypothetical protein
MRGKRTSERFVEYDAEARAARRSWWIAGAVLVVVLGGSVAWKLRGLPTSLRGVRGPAVTAAAPIELAGIDLRAVHADLLPGWLVGRANAVQPGDWAALQLDYDELAQTLAPDPELSSLLNALRMELNRDGGVRADEAFALLDEWNAYLDRKRQPLLLRGGVITGSSPHFYVKAYEVLHDGEAGVGDDSFRARILHRIDQTNVVEGYLGFNSNAEEGAFVIADRLGRFVLAELWPILDMPPGTDPTGEAAVDQIRASLAADTFATLVATAPTRRAMLAVTEGVGDRATTCGSNFGMVPPGWYGYDADTLDLAADFAQRDALDDCPSITLDEVDFLRQSRVELLGDRAMPGAVEALAALVARGVLVHEVRHAADAAAGADAPHCVACDDPPAPVVAAEMRAYLASFGHPDGAALSLFQACRPDARWGANGVAIERLEAGWLGDTCDTGPGDAFTTAAREEEERLFGASPEVLLPADLPTRLLIP